MTKWTVEYTKKARICSALLEEPGATELASACEEILRLQNITEKVEIACKEACICGTPIYLSILPECKSYYVCRGKKCPDYACRNCTLKNAGFCNYHHEKIPTPE